MGCTNFMILTHVQTCIESLDIPLNMWYQVKTKVKEHTYQKIASHAIEALNISPIDWNRIFPYLLSYFEGGKVVKMHEEAVRNLIKYFEENNIDPVHRAEIVNEMDCQIKPLVYDVPISKLVPFIKKQFGPKDSP